MREASDGDVVRGVWGVEGVEGVEGVDIARA